MAFHLPQNNQSRKMKFIFLHKEYQYQRKILSSFHIHHIHFARFKCQNHNSDDRNNSYSNCQYGKFISLLLFVGQEILPEGNMWEQMGHLINLVCILNYYSKYTDLILLIMIAALINLSLIHI